MSDNLKGVWIDGALWESKDFKAIEKHLLQKIKDLDNENGCTAMNAWFADFLGISKSRVSQIISKFKDKKLISVKLKYNGKEVVGRVIKILKGGMLYFKEGIEKNVTPLSNPKDPSLIFSEDTYRVLNNRVNNLEREKKEALSKIESLELENAKLQIELEELKNKEKKALPKSSAKKVSQDVPPTEEELESELDYKPFYFDFLKPYPFTGWSKQLINNFYLYCEAREKKEKEKNPRYSFNESGIKDTIRQISASMVDYGMNITEISVQEATPTPWVNLQPLKVKNRLERERIKNQSNQENDDGTPAYMMGLQ